MSFISSKFQSRFPWLSRLWLGALLLAPLIPLGCGGGSDGGSNPNHSDTSNFTTSSVSVATSSTPASSTTPESSSTPTSTPKSTTTPKPTPQIFRVACVGDSITKGAGTTDATLYSYPAVLQKMLGRYYWVRNFGNGGTTVMNDGAKPYQEQPEYQDALAFKANIVVIELGINDSGSPFPQSSASFLHDYAQLITRFRRLNSSVRVFACLPVASYPADAYREGILRPIITPLIKRAAQNTHSQIIDLFTPLKNKPQLFQDDIHPDNEGAHLIASAVAREFRKSGITSQGITPLAP